MQTPVESDIIAIKLKIIEIKISVSVQMGYMVKRGNRCSRPTKRSNCRI